MRRALSATALLLALSVLGCGKASPDAPSASRVPPLGPPPDAQVGARHPNLLVVTTDDQTAAQFSRRTMPRMRRFFARGGTLFTDSISAPPLCCPSRAGFLTGDYAHNHGVLTNDPGYQHLRDKLNILPFWLHDAGYETGLVGKYLNGFPVLSESPPGWDYAFGAGGVVGYFDFDVGVDGSIKHFGGGRYATDVYSGAARRFIRDSGSRDNPFFLWLTYNAPHTVPDGAAPCAGEAAQPPDRSAYERFATTPLPRTPAFGERDVSDKGRWVQGRAPLSAGKLAKLRLHWRCALSTLPSVDRGLASIVAELRRTHQLDRTIVVFTSDNGYFYGEHRITDGKEIPYEPALRVPLAIRVPAALRDGRPPAESPVLVSNVDLAPTLLDFAHAQPCAKSQGCRVLDGHSLLPLLQGESVPWSSGRAIPLELDEKFDYEAFRTPNEMFMRLRDDPQGAIAPPEEELYRLDEDPFELRNELVGGAGAAARTRLEHELDALTRCRGTSGPQACP